MFVKGCPSRVSFTSDEVKVALQEYMNGKILPGSKIKVSRVTINRSGEVEIVVGPVEEQK